MASALLEICDRFGGSQESEFSDNHGIYRCKEISKNSTCWFAFNWSPNIRTWIWSTKKYAPINRIQWINIETTLPDQGITIRSRIFGRGRKLGSGWNSISIENTPKSIYPHVKFRTDQWITWENGLCVSNRRWRGCRIGFISEILVVSLSME